MDKMLPYKFLELVRLEMRPVYSLQGLPFMMD
jgi:hypothetical protein